MKPADAVREQIENLPELPGVYIFKDKKGKIIYVGKARSIKKRVKSHFQRPVDEHHRLMLKQVALIDWLVTANETEALVLEYNLIKKERPRFNVMYRDDKSYPYIVVTLRDEWPRVMLTRNRNIEGARYFGPYPKASAAKKTLDYLLRIFPLRSCRGEAPGKKGETPCLYYHIGKCSAPCIDAIDRETYMRYVAEVVEFLSGKDTRLIDRLESEMRQAAANLEFEKAAALREKLKAARYVLSQQRVLLEKPVDADVFGVYVEGGIYVRVLTVRRGRLIGARGLVFDINDISDALRRSTFIHYTDEEDIPDEVILPGVVSEEIKKEIEEYLTEKRGKKVRVTTPVRGIKKNLLELAQENAAQSYYWFLFQSRGSLERAQKSLQELQEVLGLTRVPLRIEAYDMSGVMGESAVGSMVVFEEGHPKKAHYRKFKIRIRKDSDYHKMNEVLLRRLSKLSNSNDPSFSRKPDLILVDGGKPQLSAAVDALEKAGLLGEVEVAALAKKNEELFLPGRSESIKLPPDSEALKLLMRIRDESHRFAVAYFRQLEEKRIKASELDSIKGIGPARKKRLLEAFGSVDNIRKASVSELASVVPEQVAVRIKEALG